MRPRTTNSSTQTFDVHRVSFESVGALAFVNEYSAVSPMTPNVRFAASADVRIGGVSVGDRPGPARHMVGKNSLKRTLECEHEHPRARVRSVFACCRSLIAGHLC